MDEEVRQEFGAVRQEIAGLRADLREIVGQAVADLRLHFDVTTEQQMARLDRSLEALALLDQKVDRRSDQLEAKMDAGFAETRNLIRFIAAQ